jgi:hypothetical protein
MRGRAALFGGGLACVLALAGCGGGSEDAEPAPTSSTSAVAAVPPGYPVGTEPGLDYTEPGTALELGDSATVAWQPTPAAKIGALRISVTAIQRTTFAASFKDWKVDDAVASYAPYFVQASIANVGPTDFGGLPVPLYGETSADTLLEPSGFASAFKPCTPSSFPEPFGTGQVVPVCLVLLVPEGGELTGVTFRPTPEFTPIVWRGPVQTIGADPSPSATMAQ